jgi:hypothetical protein
VQAGTPASPRYDSGPITNLESVPLVQHRLVAARFTRGMGAAQRLPARVYGCLVRTRRHARLRHNSS